MKTKKITIILLLCGISCAGQEVDNNMSNMKKETEKIDNLCKVMSDECRIEILNKVDGSLPYLGRHWFTDYLYWLYDSTRNIGITVSEKQINEGRLLRIAEGKIRWELVEAFFGEEYDKPTEMTETEYFFLNNELVKISISKGHTDYNAIPSNYWIVIRQLDLSYQKDTLANKKAFWHVWGSVTEYNEEVAERYMKEWNVSEDTLLKKGGELLEKMITAINK
jgi:hypothetical protein